LKTIVCDSSIEDFISKGSIANLDFLVLKACRDEPQNKIDLEGIIPLKFI